MVSLFARLLLFSWRPSCSHNAAFAVSSTCVEFLWQWFRIHDVLFCFFFCSVIDAKTRDLSVVLRFFSPVSGSRSQLLDKILSQYSEKQVTGRFRVRFARRTREFSLLLNVKTCCGAHRILYTLATGVFFARRGAVAAWGWPHSYYRHIECLRMSGVIISSPCVVSWFAQGK